ncbi:MAG: RecX family transcriptional regulator [Cyclobacteriaceae bacterium]|nr:RecX family transcriptional regulator [Cyclobacteriaceae bacterium]
MYYEEDHFNKKKKTLSIKEAMLKGANFCAYQERSQYEVRNKLYTYGLHENEVDEVLSDLIVQGFVNEERFAKTYVGGKFRVKKWGRIKILQGLKHHKISEYCIRQAMKEIDEDYETTLIELLEKKSKTIKGADDFDRNTKLARYAIGRGFEGALVWEVIKRQS